VTVLLDSHTFLWFVAGDLQLSPVARAAIEDMNNDRFLSIASAWEIGIKVSLGKLPLSQPFDVFLPKQLADNSIDLLPITPEHIYQSMALPFHHRDPFDRIILAQSIVEGMPLLSGDTAFDAYGITRVW
jgi:PIN domain nuclease of toxin-antitoxin system